MNLDTKFIKEKIKLKSKLGFDSFVFTKSRKSITRNLISVLICITIAVIVALLIATALGNNPFTLLQDLFTKAFIDPKTLITNIVVLGIGGLSFSFAFKAGVFNIGISGQMLMSGLMILVISHVIEGTGVKLPSGLGPVLMILVAIVFSALVATISSLLKVFLNVNEVVSAILLNWIIFFIARLVIFEHYNPGLGVFSQSIDIPEQFRLVAPSTGGWLPALIIFIILVIGIFVLTKYTIFGHKVYSVGANESASVYAGYNVKLIKIVTMAISGAIAGLMALVFYTSRQSPSIPMTYDQDALPNEGFNGIAVGLIALNNPIAIVPVAMIMGLFSSSAPFLSLPPSYSQLITGLIILGSAMFVIFSHYKPWIWFFSKWYGYKFGSNYQKYENQMEILISQYKYKLGVAKNILDINKISGEYKNNRTVIKQAYDKNNLILLAQKIYQPNNQTQHIIKKKNDDVTKQLIKYQNSKLKKSSKLKVKKTNYYNGIINYHKNVLTAYNWQFDLELYKIFQQTNNKKLLYLISKFVWYAKKKHEKFNEIIVQSINNHDFLQKDLLDLKNKINNKHNHLINAFVSLLNREIQNTTDFDKFVFRHINYFSTLQIKLLKNVYFQTIKNFNSKTTWTTESLIVYLSTQNVAVHDLKTNYSAESSKQKLEKFVQHYNELLKSIEQKTTSNNEKIVHAKKQATHWIENNVKNGIKKELWWTSIKIKAVLWWHNVLVKIKKSPNVQNVTYEQIQLQRLIKKAKKINLPFNEHKELVDEIQNLYLEIEAERI